MKKAPLAYLQWKLAQAEDAETQSHEAVVVGFEELQEIHDCFVQMKEALEYYQMPSIYTDGDATGHVYVLEDAGRFARRVLYGIE